MMKKINKSWFRSLKRFMLALSTALLIILTHLIAPVPATVIASTDTSTEVEEKPALTPEEIARQQKLIEGDKLFLAGNISEAEKIYRSAKASFTKTITYEPAKAAILDPNQLPPAGKVYWRESSAGITSNLETRTSVPLQLLVDQYPEFIPGHLRFAEVLQKYNRPKEALGVLERATSRYPNESTLAAAKVTALAKSEKWMEASLAARQFALLNPEHPEAPEFNNLALKNLNEFKSHIGSEIRGNVLANIITGALGYAVTGNVYAPLSAIESTVILLQGEESIGESVAEQAKKQLDVITDETVTTYIHQIGEKLAKVAGRDEFKYEFFVIPREDLNAFALPGGKIFINAGAITAANSEAELAGLLGHELAHTVLSHGFQLVTQGNLIADVTQYLPLGGTIGQLFALGYSRDMERQADNLGTRLIVASGYAADGLRNLMATLTKEQKNFVPTWLSSHPGGAERVGYMENLIAQSNYNRYNYEGVIRHTEIQARVKELMKEKAEANHESKPEDEPSP